MNDAEWRRAMTSLEEATTTISPAEAAQKLGVEASTLANWRWAGRGPRYIRVGSRVRYRLADVASWLDSRTRRSTSDGGTHA